MTTNPLPFTKKWANIIAKLQSDVRELKNGHRWSPSSLRIKFTDMVDVALGGVRAHQVPTWDPVLGKWVPGGGTVITRHFTVSGTGLQEISEDLIDPSQWPADQVWDATAVVVLAGDFPARYQTGSVVATLGVSTAAVTLDADASTLLTFTDGTLDVSIPLEPFQIPLPQPSIDLQLTDGAITGPPTPGPDVDFAPWRGSADPARSDHEGSVALLYHPGATPHVNASFNADPTAYPDGGVLDVTVHLYPRP